MRTILSTVLVAVILAVASPAWASFVKGPYIQQVTKTGVSFMWHTDSPMPGTVAWGEDESLTGGVLNSPAGTTHEVRLEGLKQNRAYYYRVTSGSQASTTYRFQTAPDAYTPFRFVAYGDSRTGFNEHRRVAAGILSEEPAFVSNSGDLVGTGSDEIGWQEHFNITKDLMATTPYLPAIGNHDKEGLDASQYKRYFSLPPNGEESHRGNYYYFDWGNVRLITLDDMIVAVSAGSIHYDWLMGVLQDAADDPYIQHIFIQAHVGPYTAKPGRNGAQNLRSLMDTFSHYGVTAIFSGHDHHYYRGQSYNGVNFIVTGGGGAGLYDCEPRAEHGVRTVKCAKEHHYVVFDVNGDTVDGTAKYADGRVIEEFQWKSKKQLPPKPDDTEPPVEDDGDDTDTPVADGEEDVVDGDSPVFDGDLPGDGDTTAPDSPADGGSRTPEEYEPEFGFAGCRSVSLIYGGTAALFVLLAGVAIWRRRRNAA